MRKSFLTASLIAAGLFLTSCGGGDDTPLERSSTDNVLSAMATASRGSAVTQAPGSSSSPQGAGSTPSSIQTVRREVISIATVSIEVDVVNAAVSQLRTIAESLDGFIENMNSAGQINQQQANATIRVPQFNFFPALERVEALGKVIGRSVTTEDVSERFIDLNARLKSAEREEQSLLSLLGRVQAVGDVLTIERELTRVRGEIERFQGQLNFLERRVDYSTINLTIQQAAKLAEPPSAALEMKVSDVSRAVQEIRALTSVMKGTIDSVGTSTKNDKTVASITLHVFSEDFSRMVDAIEDKGDVDLKDVREGKEIANVVRPEQPDARIVLSLSEKTDWMSVVIGFAAFFGVVAVLGGIGLYLGKRFSK